MPYKIHTKFHPSKPRPDRDLCDCHTSLGWPREGDAWPVEAGCDAGWLKGSPYGKGKRVCDGAVSDPRLLPWGWHTSPEMLHQWLWMGRGSPVGVWGWLRPPCMHQHTHASNSWPRGSHRQPTPCDDAQPLRAAACPCREPLGVLATWPVGTPQGEAREQRLPATHPEAGSLPREWCLHGCPSPPGRWTPLSPWRAGWGGTWPGMFWAGTDRQPSARPVAASQAFGL